MSWGFDWDWRTWRIYTYRARSGELTIRRFGPLWLRWDSAEVGKGGR